MKLVKLSVFALALGLFAAFCAPKGEGDKGKTDSSAMAPATTEQAPPPPPPPMDTMKKDSTAAPAATPANAPAAAPAEKKH